MADSPARPTPEALLAHVAWVRRLARLLVADEQDADDVEQETWRHALERPPARAGNLRRWLSAVARNVARKRIHSQETRARHERNAGPSSAASAASEVTARAELHRRVVEAVLALDELYRAPLLLRFFDDRSAADVAQRLGVPVETARTRIKRGLALVRARLGGDLAVALAPLLLHTTPVGLGMTGAASGVAAGVAGVAGLMLGGAIVSKLVKVGVAVVVASAALFGSYRIWIAPRLAETQVVHASKEGPGTPAPVSVTGQPPAAAPMEVAREATRNAIDHAKGDGSPEPPSPTALGTIEGTVLDASGRPVAGATVAVDRLGVDPAARSSYWSNRNYARLFRGIAAKGDGAHTWRATTSADDGRFRFDAIDPRDRCAVSALRDPLGIGWNEAIAFTGDPPLARVLITLQAGVVVFGKVQDPSGQPVATANVMLGGATRAPDPETSTFNSEIEDWVNTSEDGTYRSLPLSWRHLKVHVYAHDSRPDLAQLDLPWEELPAGVSEVRRDLTMPTLTTLRGRILGPDGQPARLAKTVVPKLGADAQRNQSRRTITAVALAKDPRTYPEVLEQLGTPEPGVVYLDADRAYGTIQFEEDRYEIPLHVTGLRFVAIVGRDRLLGVAEIPTPTAAPDVVIDPGLLSERSLLHGLRLHFRDGRLGHEGEPLAGVRVVATTIARNRDGQLTMSVINFGPESELTPDRDLELPLTPVTIMMSCNGFVTRTCSLDPSQAGAATELTIEFVPACGAIGLHVEDQGGQPIAGSRLRIYHVVGHDAGHDAEMQPLILDHEGPTDEHGDCVLAGLPAGPCVVVAEKEGYAPVATRVSIDDDAMPDDPIPADLVMERGYEVTLQARLADGTAAPSGQVALLTEEGVPLYDQFHPHSGGARLAGRKLRVIDGTYVVRCRVPAFAAGEARFVAAPGASVDVELAPTR